MKKLILLLVLLSGIGWAQSAGTVSQANAASTGTTLNYLASQTATNTMILASSTTAPAWIVTANAGTTGNPSLALTGQAGCNMDSTISSAAAGYYVIANASTGQCHAQSAAPASGTWVVGTLAAASTTSGSTALVTISGYFYGGGGAVSYNGTQFTPALTDTNFGTVSLPEVISTVVYDSTANSTASFGSGQVTAGTVTTNCVATTSATTNCTVGNTSTYTYLGWQLEIPANTLVAAKKIRVDVDYSQAAVATIPNFNFSTFLCTVSACASGTVTAMTNSVVAETQSQNSQIATFDYAGTAAPGSSVDVIASVGNTGGTGSGILNYLSTVAQPVAIATNGNLFLDFGLKFSSISQAGNYVRLLGVTVTVFN
jgi:hypothetical protein